MRRPNAPTERRPLDAHAVRTLAALWRAGLTVRGAVSRWPDLLGDEAPAEVRRAARRARLQAPLAEALKPLGSGGADGVAVAQLLLLAARVGGDVATLLERAGDAIERRNASVAAARAAAAGMNTSAWLVAALPLGFVPIAVRAGLYDADAGSAVFVIAGVILDVAGLWWMRRLVPTADPDDDAVARVADLTAAALAGGLELPEALATVSPAASPGLSGRFEQAARRVRLGLPWSQALTTLGDDAVAELGRVLERSRVTGSPARDALIDLAGRRRLQAQRAFEARLRRAPVLMALPLTLCILPSFALVCVAPMLRGVLA